MREALGRMVAAAPGFLLGSRMRRLMAASKKSKADDYFKFAGPFGVYAASCAVDMDPACRNVYIRLLQACDDLGRKEFKR